MRQLRRPPPAPSIQSVSIPAPTGGLNTVAPGKAMPETDCPVLFNMVSAEHGLRVRTGYRQWNAVNTGLRTFIPYNGSASNGSKDRLFVTTDLDMWDATEESSSGLLGSRFSWPLSTGPTGTNGAAGYGSYHAVTTSAGHFLLYCDEVNGYYVYTESTDTWASVSMGGGATQVSGVNPANFCFVTVWKSRVWFIQKDTALAWYLPAGAIYGAATSLNLDRAAQFRQGGGLRALANWTQDGGAGMDDRLVAIGDGGDVAVYEGTDPANATTFSLKGTYNVGGLVAGRNIALSHGGDVLILTKSGIRPISQLVQGGDGSGLYPTAKISNLFSSLAATQGAFPGWGMYLHPEDNALLVTVPQNVDAFGNHSTEALAMSLWNRSWSRYRGMSIAAACVWHGKFYFGGAGSGYIWVADGAVDSRLLATPETFTAIQWSLITRFNSLAGRNAKVETIRPTLVSQDGLPTWEAAARYNYNLTEIGSVTLGSAGGSGSWDVGLWDSAVWQSDLGSTDLRPRGASGEGRDFAIALRGAAIGATRLVGIDVDYQVGGLL